MSTSTKLFILSSAACASVFAASFAASSATAAPVHKVCVPEASGVPTMEGPPHWVASWGGVQSSALDDPRWLGATKQTFGLGSAKAPLEARAVWAHEGTDDFLYFSMLANVVGVMTTPTTPANSPRDFYLGFHRPTPLGTERGYILHFHLGDPGAAGPVAPAYCAEDCAIGTDYWRVFVDNGNIGTCGAGGGSGAKYRVLSGAAPSWMADMASFWKVGTGATISSFVENRWAVQLRLKLAAAGAPLSSGIASDMTFWYEATVQVGGVEGAAASLGWWPRGGGGANELTKSICPQASESPNVLIHEELGDARPGCPACNADRFSALATYSGAVPSGCDRGLRIDSSGIGSLFEPSAAVNLATEPVTSRFRAFKSDGSPGANTVIAQVENKGAVAVNAPLLARFRLAGWGAAPWSVSTDHGKWKDMRGAENGVCGAGSAPACTSTSIASNAKAAITFQWEIGNDVNIGPSEYCQYGYTPPASVTTPGAACIPCPCATAGTCDATTDTGTMWSGTRAAGGAWSCVSRRYGLDQCMLVELSSPSGSVTFEQQSSWNNMGFGQMSLFEREALIDARGLPTAKGQTDQDIYLVVMPRNMPKALPGGAATGNQIMAQRAFDAAMRITLGYKPGYDATPEEKRRMIAERMQHPIPSLDELKKDPRTRIFGEKYVMAARIRPVMPPEDYARVGELLDLAALGQSEKLPAELFTQKLVDVAGPSTAADIVPTLEIYAFYHPEGGGLVYRPMTSFSVFLSHQGTLEGITWEIDGATRVGENIYRMKIPVERARRIRVRSQAIEPGELVQRPGEPGWPCGGGCACGGNRCGVVAGLNNTVPTLLAGFFFARKRRRKPAKQPKAEKSPER